MSSPQFSPRDGYLDDAVPSLQELHDSDALLDRLGARSPLADDLDNTVAAAFAVYASQLDSASVPVLRTRQALQQRVGWPPDGVPSAPVVAPFGAQSATAAAAATGPGYLADGYAAQGYADAAASHVPPTRPVPVDIVRRIAAPTPKTQVEQPSFDAVAHSVPQPRKPRPFALRLIPAVASFGAIAVLSMGASAVMTGGRSVNPGVLLNPVIGHVAEQTPVNSDGRGSRARSGTSGAPTPATVRPGNGQLNQAGTPALPGIGQPTDAPATNGANNADSRGDEAADDADSDSVPDISAEVLPVPSLTSPQAPSDREVASAAKKAKPAASPSAEPTSPDSSTAASASPTKTKKAPPGLAKKTPRP